MYRFAASSSRAALHEFAPIQQPAFERSRFLQTRQPSFELIKQRGDLLPNT